MEEGFDVNFVNNNMKSPVKKITGMYISQSIVNYSSVWNAKASFWRMRVGILWPPALANRPHWCWHATVDVWPLSAGQNAQSPMRQRSSNLPRRWFRLSPLLPVLLIQTMLRWVAIAYICPPLSHNSFSSSKQPASLSGFPAPTCLMYWWP